MYDKLSFEKRIERAHITLMGSKAFCFLSGILMLGKVEITDKVPTAATDGYNVYYNRGFCMNLPEKEFNFVVAHEAYHKALRQLTVWKRLFNEDAQLANQAADYTTNLLICDADKQSKFVKRPAMGLYDEQYRGMDTKQVFEELKKQGKGGKGQGQGGGGAEGTLDEHMWKEANAIPEEQAKKIADQIDRALREGKMLADKRGTGGNRALNEILEPEVNWRQHLREFVMEVMSGKDISTWSRPNRRYLSQGMIMPGTYSETVGELVVAADMSGSVGGQLLAMFLGEMGSLAEMLQPAKLHLLYWDTEVCRHEIYLPGQYESLVSSTKPKGGGGTSPSCITEYMKAHRIVPACTVVLTDGYVGGDWGGQWPSPVLWAVCGDRHASPTTGKMVPLREE